MYTVDKTRLTGEAPLIFALCATFAAVTAFFHLLIAPLYGTLLEKHAELKHYEAIISSENGYQFLKKEITGKIDTLHTRLSPLSDEKEITADPGSYLETLIAIARKSDIRFARMQPQEEKPAADLVRYPVMLTLTTTYHELGQFIAALEKMPDLFSVDRLAIETTKNGRCNVRLLVACLIPKERPDDR